MRRASSIAAFALLCCAGLASAAAEAPAAPASSGPIEGPEAGLFFDDFSQPDVAALKANGWTVRDKAGHPGIEGAKWWSEGVSLVPDADQPGNRLLRLEAMTDGTPRGTRQVQVCHQRKVLEGTYAARVRFSDSPVHGPRGDVVVQTFYAVAPLRFDLDPDYSELDWEYLAAGGWGDARTRLYGVSWQTVKLQPWASWNEALQLYRSFKGWHVLLMQVAGGRVRWFADGEPVAEHGGRHYPVSTMSIDFNLWFSPGGLARSPEVRTWREEIDWVFHARNQSMTTDEVLAQVKAWRAAGKPRMDTVPAPNPALASPCDF